MRSKLFTAPEDGLILDKLLYYQSWYKHRDRDTPRPADNSDNAKRWNIFSRRDWPCLFALLDVAAALPRLEETLPIDMLSPPLSDLWPELDKSLHQLFALQYMADHPVVPTESNQVFGHYPSRLETAAQELREQHCTTIDFFLERSARTELEAIIADLKKQLAGSWGPLERDSYPALFGLIDQALASDSFRHLTGFDHARDPYTLTLSLQDLARSGIGWHRDLYWPKEWVGEDVFTVLYALADDLPKKGGAFVYYVPPHNRVYTLYRKRHQATILWNCREAQARPFHAVTRFRTADTSRHLLILQCLRR